jgi:hypothetical protein
MPCKDNTEIPNEIKNEAASIYVNSGKELG